MTHVRLVNTNLRGVPVGDSSPNTRWPDSLVAQARAMHAEGWAIRAIAKHLDGPHHATVWRWIAGTDRKPPARVIARRVKTSTKPVASDSKSGVDPMATTTYSGVRNSACNNPLESGENDQKAPT